MAKEITKKPVVKKTVVKKETKTSVKELSEAKSRDGGTPVAVKPEIKICRYTDKNIKLSPRKLRLLANSIKKLTPASALVKLSLTNTLAARILHKAVETVVSTAKNNYNLSSESLVFDSINVDEGSKIKRMDKSHGSHFARGIIMKRHSRLIITVKGVTK